MATTTPAECDDQSSLTPSTTQVFGCDSPARRKAVSALQGQQLTINWQMADPGGRPVDLRGCLGDEDPYTGSVRLATSEVINIPGLPSPVINVEGSVVDPATGMVAVTLGADATLFAGVYLAEIAVFNDDDPRVLLFANQFYLIVNRGIFAAIPTQKSGLPSIAEIRLHMRDSSGADNPLLEEVQFDLAEIAAAIEYPILYWNETPPPICQTYTTNTFPYRYHWMQAIVSRLYVTAAHWYRRNRLEFKAQGGVGVDDLNKSAEYEAQGRQLWAEYKDFVLRRKVGLNAESAIMSSG